MSVFGWVGRSNGAELDLGGRARGARAGAATRALYNVCSGVPLQDTAHTMRMCLN